MKWNEIWSDIDVEVCKLERRMWDAGHGDPFCWYFVENTAWVSSECPHADHVSCSDVSLLRTSRLSLLYSFFIGSLLPITPSKCDKTFHSGFRQTLTLVWCFIVVMVTACKCLIVSASSSKCGCNRRLRPAKSSQKLSKGTFLVFLRSLKAGSDSLLAPLWGTALRTLSSQVLFMHFHTEFSSLFFVYLGFFFFYNILNISHTYLLIFCTNSGAEI